VLDPPGNYTYDVFPNPASFGDGSVSFNNKTGAFTWQLSPTTNYYQMFTVTATSLTLTGSTTAIVDIAEDVPVAGRGNDFWFADSEYTLPVNVATNISAFVTANGKPFRFSISPALPKNLTLVANASYVLITGTPTDLSDPAFYSVTATTTGGSSSTYFRLSVVDPGQKSPAQLQSDLLAASTDAKNALGTGSSAVTACGVITVVSILLFFWIYRRTNRKIKLTQEDIEPLLNELQGRTLSGVTGNVSLYDGTATSEDVLLARSKRPENLARSYSRAQTTTAHDSTDAAKRHGIAQLSNSTSTSVVASKFAKKDAHSLGGASNSNLFGAEGAGIGGLDWASLSDEARAAITKMRELLKELHIDERHGTALFREELEPENLSNLTDQELSGLVVDPTALAKLRDWVGRQKPEGGTMS